MWRMLEVSARVLALVLLGLHHYYILLGGIAVHWTVMFGLLCRVDFSHESTVEKFFYQVAVGTICLFSFFNVVDGRTRWRMLLFYAVVFIENAVCCLVWWFERDDPPTPSDSMYPLHWLAFLYPLLALPFGLLVMMLYYWRCHPESPIPVCLPANEFPCTKRNHSSQGRASPLAEPESQVPLTSRSLTDDDTSV